MLGRHINRHINHCPAQTHHTLRDPESEVLAVAQHGNILIVDPNESSAELARLALAPLGHPILVAPSVLDGATILREQTIDLVIVQIDPRPHGLQTLHRTQSTSPARHRTRFLAITAAQGQSELVTQLSDAVLARPFKSEHLRSTVAELLNADPKHEKARRIEIGVCVSDGWIRELLAHAIYERGGQPRVCSAAELSGGVLAGLTHCFVDAGVELASVTTVQLIHVHAVHSDAKPDQSNVMLPFTHADVTRVLDVCFSGSPKKGGTAIDSIHLAAQLGALAFELVGRKTKLKQGDLDPLLAELTAALLDTAAQVR